jgi:hypothetical protein
MNKMLERLGCDLYYGTTIEIATMKNLIRLEVLMAVTVNITACCSKTPCSDIPEEAASSISRVAFDESSRFLWKVSTYLPDYTPPHPRRQ